jgi:hypothetical protein
MVFYRYTGKDDLWLGKYGKSERTLIPNEILTQSELNSIKTKCPRLNIDRAFKTIDIPKSETYSMFGVRFEDGTDHNSKLESKRKTVKKLRIKEDRDYNDSLKRPTIDEMRDKLREFATNNNRYGFEAANYGWGEETLYDFYIDNGFYGTANLEDMKGYFTWVSPSGNGCDIDIEYDFNEDYGFDHFLNKITEMDYDDTELIEQVLKNAYGFTEPRNWQYVKDIDSSDGTYTAKWDGNDFSGIIEGESVEDGVYVREFDNFIEFVEELEYLM